MTIMTQLAAPQKRAAQDALAEIRTSLEKLKYAQQRLHKAGLLEEKEALGKQIYDLDVLKTDIALRVS